MTCAVVRGKIMCWGLFAALHSVDVPNAKLVRLGQRIGCAVDTFGGVTCFGDDLHAPPTKIQGIPPAKDVVCGWSGACAVTPDDDVWCWGSLQAEENYPPTKMRVL